MTTSKHITPYQDLAMENAIKNNLKQLVSAILLSAIEDADVEFLTDDYEEWKYYREKREMILPYSGSGPDKIKSKRNGDETLHCACFLKRKKGRRKMNFSLK